MQLLDVAIFDLLHEGFALEKIAAQISSELAGHDEKLIVENLGKRDGAAGENEMRTPLEHEAGVPEGGDAEKNNCGGQSGALGPEEVREAIEKYGQAENEKRSERNEKAIAVGGDAGPVRIAGDEKIEREKGGEKRSARAALPAPEDK